MPEIAADFALDPRRHDASGAALHLHVRNDLTLVSLRGDPEAEDRAFLSLVGRALDLLLPQEIGAVAARGDGLSAMQLGPDEWLLRAPELAADALRGLCATLQPDQGAAVDLSDHLTTLELSGANAPTVLRKGCALDLHPRELMPPRALQTIISGVDVTLHIISLGADGRPATIELFVRRSFAVHLQTWLIQAGREFHLRAGANV